jgi:hypothetical protein
VYHRVCACVQADLLRKAEDLIHITRSDCESQLCMTYQHGCLLLAEVLEARANSSDFSDGVKAVEEYNNALRSGFGPLPVVFASLTGF